MKVDFKEVLKCKCLWTCTDTELPVRKAPRAGCSVHSRKLRPPATVEAGLQRLGPKWGLVGSAKIVGFRSRHGGWKYANRSALAAVRKACRHEGK